MKIKIELCVKLDFDNKVNKSNLSTIVITSHHKCQISNSNKIKKSSKIIFFEKKLQLPSSKKPPRNLYVSIRKMRAQSCSLRELCSDTFWTVWYHTLTFYIATISWKNNSKALRSSFSLAKSQKLCWNQKCLRQTFNILIKNWQIYCKDNKLAKCRIVHW